MPHHDSKALTAMVKASKAEMRMDIESRIAEEMAWEEWRLRQHDCGCEETRATLNVQRGLEIALNIVKDKRMMK